MSGSKENKNTILLDADNNYDLMALVGYTTDTGLLPTKKIVSLSQGYEDVTWSNYFTDSELVELPLLVITETFDDWAAFTFEWNVHSTPMTYFDGVAWLKTTQDVQTDKLVLRTKNVAGVDYLIMISVGTGAYGEFTLTINKI